MIWGSGGSKSSVAKAAGAEPAGQMRDEKLHDGVARSTFRCQKCKKQVVLEYFLRLGCGFAWEAQGILHRFAELLRFWCWQVRKLRKPRRIAAFLMLSSSKTEEASQNCCVFDVVKFKNWGSLAELLRFWCCQVQKLRKSRRIVSSSSLQIDRERERQRDGWIGRQKDRQTDRSTDRRPTTTPLRYTTTTTTSSTSTTLQLQL